MARIRYRWWVAALAVLVVLAVAAGVTVLALVRPWSVPAAGPPAGPGPSPEPVPVEVLAQAGTATGTGAPVTEAGVTEAIDDLVRHADLGDRVSMAVVDAASGEHRYRRAADRPTVPASAIKLVTALTVLAVRGPAYQLPTVAVAGAEPGEVVLVGGGDPTLAGDEDGFYPGAAQLAQLADQIRRARGDAPVTRITVDATLFTGEPHGPWSADIVSGGYVGPITALMTDGGRVDPDPDQGQAPAPRYEAPELAAGTALAELLELEPGAVRRGSAPDPPGGRGEADPTEPGAELGRVVSPPLVRLVEFMLGTSDNVVAEMLARQVALARDEPASFAGAGRAMAAVLAEWGIGAGGSPDGAVPDDGVLADGSRLADGSGLSRQNRLTADLVTALLVTAATEPAFAGLFAGLPVAGWSGTLAHRYRTPQPVATEPGAGVVRAKTGSLDGVSALAGLVVTADGRLLMFAVLADAVPAGQVAARAVLDRIAAVLAGCGCR